MKTIAFVTQKGGSGKSTLCIGLAVAARQTGASVCMVEMDRQATIGNWAELRQSEPPDVVQIDSTELAAVRTRLSNRAFDYAFIDTPGAIGPETLAAIRAADLCLVPSRPTPADLHAIRPTLAAIYRMEKRFAFILNQTPVRSYRVREAVNGLVALGVLPDVNIVQRNDHQDAIGTGQGVTELNPTGKAAEEIRQLWRWVAAQVSEIGYLESHRSAPAHEHVRAA
jgi:chromosome partitioning protein